MANAALSQSSSAPLVGHIEMYCLFTGKEISAVFGSEQFEEITESLLNVLVITVTKPNKKFKFNRFYNRLKKKGFIIYPGKMAKRVTSGQPKLKADSGRLKK